MAKQRADENRMAGMMADTAGAGDKEVAQKTYDAAAVAEKFKKLNEEVAQKKEAELKRKEALAKVKVSDEDVAMVAEHCWLSTDKAKELLQQHKGNAQVAMAKHLGL